MFGRKAPKSNVDPAAGPAVVLVGHCGFDSGGLTRLAQASAPRAVVVRVNSDAELTPWLRTGNLLLVNRVLDGRFGAASGVELIREILAREDVPAMMLVSNYADAQEQAVNAGARPGFGKSEMGDPDVSRRIADAIDPSPSRSPESA